MLWGKSNVWLALHDSWSLQYNPVLRLAKHLFPGVAVTPSYTDAMSRVVVSMAQATTDSKLWKQHRRCSVTVGVGEVHQDVDLRPGSSHSRCAHENVLLEGTDE